MYNKSFYKTPTNRGRTFGGYMGKSEENDTLNILISLKNEIVQFFFVRKINR